MKKIVFLFSITATFMLPHSFAVSTDSSTADQASSSPRDTGMSIVFPENFEKDIQLMMKDIPASKGKKPKAKTNDPLLAKSSYWYAYDWIKDGEGYEWRYLSDTQLFLQEGGEITGYVYGNRNLVTPFGPRCYIQDVEYNVSNGELTGDAFLCSSGKIFFFFYANGRYYLAIISDYDKIMYSTD